MVGLLSDAGSSRLSAFKRGHKCPRYTTAPDKSGFLAPFMGRYGVAGDSSPGLWAFGKTAIYARAQYRSRSGEDMNYIRIQPMKLTGQYQFPHL